MMRDNDLGVVRVRAFGTYDFRVVDPKLFLKEVAGSDHNFRLDEFADTMRSRIVSVFSDALASAQGAGVRRRQPLRRAGRGAAAADQSGDRRRSTGSQIASFVVENVSVPPEVEQAIDKRSSMAAVGNLNDYVKFQMAQGMEKGGGAGGMATEMAVGLSIAQQMMQQQGLAPARRRAAAPSAPRPQPRRSCSRRPTSRRSSASPEQDVLGIIESGELAPRRSARPTASSARR